MTPKEKAILITRVACLAAALAILALALSTVGSPAPVPQTDGFSVHRWPLLILAGLGVLSAWFFAKGMIRDD